MPRKKRSPRTSLAQFILDLRDRHKLTFRELGRIAGCAQSIVHAWSTGSLPCESVTALKSLCEHYGVPLAVPLTGTPERVPGVMPIDFYYREEEVFNGLARVQITKLVERQRKGEGV